MPKKSGQLAFRRAVGNSQGNMTATKQPTEIKRSDRSQRGDVREKILDVAERVFAENGVDGSTIRFITTEAGVNVAAVNYYFRSKEELYEEIVKRRQTPLTAERLRRLEECLLTANKKRPTVKDILRALVEPSIQLCFQYPYFARLSSRLRFDKNKSLWSEYLAHQDTMMSKYLKALSVALPDLPKDEVYWRLVYVLAEIQHTWGLCPLPEGETQKKLADRIVAFFSAGMRAPLPE